jgi:hypothetical protein
MERCGQKAVCDGCEEEKKGRSRASESFYGAGLAAAWRGLVRVRDWSTAGLPNDAIFVLNDNAQWKTASERRKLPHLNSRAD